MKLILQESFNKNINLPHLATFCILCYDSLTSLRNYLCLLPVTLAVIRKWLCNETKVKLSL
jgi:hypothetical protein